MKIEKFDSKKEIGRVPMARGEGSNGEKFVMSILVDGSGVVLEFKADEAYFLSTPELVKELLIARAKNEITEKLVGVDGKPLREVK